MTDRTLTMGWSDIELIKRALKQYDPTKNEDNLPSTIKDEIQQKNDLIEWFDC